MKRCVMILATLVGLFLANNAAQAGWQQLSYSGYQPWWNVFAKRYKCLTPEEERLQKFWHDYYRALKDYYDALDNIDWVAYYKNHGYQINSTGSPYGGGGRINYAPVFVAPTIQWAVPGSGMGGPSGGGSFQGGYPGMQGGYPGGYAVPTGYPGQ